MDPLDLMAEWTGRLDRFCAELEQHGMVVERDGLTVKIFVPGRLEEVEHGLSEQTP